MATHPTVPRLLDIVEAIERIRTILDGLLLTEFENDWQKQWVVQRGVEIISEASRHLIPDIKSRHPNIPWQKVAGIGNILRHNYESISAPVLWALGLNDLPELERVCRAELDIGRQ